MAKMTLLQMVQNILSSMSSDEVNSIYDTVESQQVAEIIKETYYDLFSNVEVPEKVGIAKLTSVSDLTRPNYLKIPDDILSFDWVKYRDSSDGKYKTLSFCDPKTFFEKVGENGEGSDTTLITDASGITYYVKNNEQPRFYTLLNDEYLVTNSYNSAYDTTLQASKTFAWGEIEEEWDASDTFIPNLDNDLFPLFLSEAKSVCFITLKQMANQKEEQRARKHRVHLQYRKWKSLTQRAYLRQGINYARKG